MTKREESTGACTAGATAAIGGVGDKGGTIVGGGGADGSNLAKILNEFCRVAWSTADVNARPYAGIRVCCGFKRVALSLSKDNISVAGQGRTRAQSFARDPRAVFGQRLGESVRQRISITTAITSVVSFSPPSPLHNPYGLSQALRHCLLRTTRTRTTTRIPSPHLSRPASRTICMISRSNRMIWETSRC